MSTAPLKYPAPLRFLHWTIAALILAQFLIGPVMVDLDKADPLRGTLFGLHKSFGVLVLVRLAVRWRAVLPAVPERFSAFEIRLAALVHPALYLGMLLVPLSGWLVSDLSGRGVRLFGLPLPKLAPTVEGIGTWPGEVHTVVAFTLLGLVALHVGGVLKHRYLDRTCILHRML